MLGQLTSMGERAVGLIDVAMEAFRGRDLAVREQLHGMDDEVDRLNWQLVQDVVDLRHDAGQMQWGLRMLQVSRHLERAADHAVAIAERAWYATTGELRELD